MCDRAIFDTDILAVPLRGRDIVLETIKNVFESCFLGLADNSTFIEKNLKFVGPMNDLTKKSV